MVGGDEYRGEPGAQLRKTKRGGHLHLAQRNPKINKGMGILGGVKGMGVSSNHQYRGHGWNIIQKGKNDRDLKIRFAKKKQAEGPSFERIYWQGARLGVQGGGHQIKLYWSEAGVLSTSGKTDAAGGKRRKLGVLGWLSAGRGEIVKIVQGMGRKKSKSLWLGGKKGMASAICSFLLLWLERTSD